MFSLSFSTIEIAYSRWRLAGHPAASRGSLKGSGSGVPPLDAEGFPAAYIEFWRGAERNSSRHFLCALLMKQLADDRFLGLYTCETTLELDLRQKDNIVLS